MCNQPEKPADDKLATHLRTLWIHQNTVLWGRLQSIGVLQVAVVAGWYALFSSDRFRYAALLCVLGVTLSFAVFALVDCDLEWRRDIKKRLVDLDPRIFPAKVPSISGWFVIRGISLGFCGLNLLLLAVTVITKATLAGWVVSCRP